MSASAAGRPSDQLEWEARNSKFAALAAALTAILLIGGNILLQAGALSSRPDNERDLLRAIHTHEGAFLTSAVVQGLSYVAFAGVLYYLYRATKARKPDLPSFAGVLVILGPLLYAVARPITDLGQIDSADTFLQSGAQTVDRAKDLLDDRDVLSVALGSGGTLALAIGLVLISINAMRVGLLTRFMGIIGAIIGALYVLPILSGPLIVQLFWTIALGLLFVGRWPGGRGPAWSTGEAEPWPGGTTIGGGGAQDEALPPPDVPGEQPVQGTPAQRRRKRKKKKR